MVGYLGLPEGTLLVSLMYNGSRPNAARQAQWNLFRELGANGVVIPTDSAMVPPVQLGGDESLRPAWLPEPRRAGLRRRVPLRAPRPRITSAASIVSGPPRARSDQDDSTDDGEYPEQWRNRHALLLVGGGVTGPTSRTFSFRVKEKPPRTSPSTPRTIRTIPISADGFIPAYDPE